MSLLKLKNGKWLAYSVIQPTDACVKKVGGSSRLAQPRLSQAVTLMDMLLNDALLVSVPRCAS